MGFFKWRVMFYEIVLKVDCGCFLIIVKFLLNLLEYVGVVCD